MSCVGNLRLGVTGTVPALPLVDSGQRHEARSCPLLL